ncbi:MAG: SusD/RagB family nutrient-binding outer membrane lipoprotein [Rufibacter sp.]
MRKILYTSLLAASMVVTTGCEEWLDVNTNPNGPDQVVQPHLYLSPIQAEIALGIQFDARYLAKYIGNWHQGNSTGDTWDRHSYVASSDAAGQIWRSTYYTSGLNLRDMIAKSEEEKKWDFAGVGYALQAFNWQITTDYHGEIIVSQAFDPSRSDFDYDTQEFAYEEVRRLAQKALDAFAKHKAEPHPNSRLAEADLIYAGDAAKWEKFVYGLLAINASRLTNKADFKTNWAPKVIEYVDKSFAGNADDAAVRFEGTVSANANFLGPMRGNFLTVRQSRFITNLLSGRNVVLADITVDPVTQTVTPNVLDPVFTTEHLKDPRITVMLSPSPSGKYNGIGFGSSTEITVANDRPYNLYGTTSDAAAANATAQGKYLFQNNVPFPLMTYAQLQFVKAEAAYLVDNKTLALESYTKGVVAHMDFVRTFTTAGAQRTQFDQRRTAYMANKDLVPTDPAELTLGHILLQKYIAQWGWGFIDTWSDLRRYDYNVVTEVDPEFGTRPVFVGYELPPAYLTGNNGKPAQRFRPRYNSEYIWNIEALRKIGGLDVDYHTKEMWFSEQ